MLWKVGSGNEERNGYGGGGEEDLVVHRSLTHPTGAVRQVCWSSDGMRLIGRMKRTILLWDVSVSSISA